MKGALDMSEIVVIGSLNVDMMVETNQIPRKGETVLGKAYYMMPGGKGLNQASAIGWLGKKVTLIGCIGKDAYGNFLLEKMGKNIDSSRIKAIHDVNTGMAMVTLSSGDNSIIVVPGANYCLTVDMIKDNIDAIKEAKLVVMQMEIPMEVIEFTLDYCYENGIQVLLNPAPAVRLSETICKKVTYITPNRGECPIIYGREDIKGLLLENQNKLIVTCGEDGVIYSENDQIVTKAAKKVEVVDTTGAGDAFNGAFAVGIVDGYSFGECIEKGNLHAAKVVQVLGTLL